MSSVPPIPPPPPPSSRSGCVTALLAMIGIVLLLPGLCAVFMGGWFQGPLSREWDLLLSACMIAAAAGIALIIWAARRS